MLGGTYPDAAPLGFCPVNGFRLRFLWDATIVRFVQNHQNPYGIQASLAVEFEPLPTPTVSISGLHVRGVHLGSFFNVNQPDPSGRRRSTTHGKGRTQNTYLRPLEFQDRAVARLVSPLFTPSTLSGPRAGFAVRRTPNHVNKRLAHTFPTASAHLVEVHRDGPKSQLRA